MNSIKNSKSLMKKYTLYNNDNSRVCTVEIKINNDIKSLNNNVSQLNIQVESQKNNEVHPNMESSICNT